MRFLADAGISPKTVDFLRRSGHYAVHVRELAMRRAPDRVLAEKARADSRILLTFDLGAYLWPRRSLNARKNVDKTMP